MGKRQPNVDPALTVRYLSAKISVQTDLSAGSKSE